MSIEVTCPQCNAVHRVNDRLAGKRVRCSKCSGAVTIPALPQPAESAVVDGKVIDRAEQASASSSRERLRNGAAATVANGHASSLEADVDKAIDEAFDDRAMETFAAHQRVNHSSLVGSSAPVLADTPVETFVDTPAPKVAQVTTPDSDSPAINDDDDDAMPAKLHADEGELDMTPMVDVTFLLLIFFMITAAFSLQKSIESPRQKSDAPSMSSQEQEPEDTDVITVQINEFGSYLVLGPDWEKETPGKQNLIAALKDGIGDGSNPVKLAIEVHEGARIKALVDCMDAGVICGYTETQVTQVEGFD